jgi:hypothetical protein
MDESSQYNGDDTVRTNIGASRTDPVEKRNHGPALAS